MQEVIKVHAGLDVHKDSIAIGVAEPGRTPGRVLGTIAHDVPKLLKQLSKLGGPARVHVVYEAAARVKVVVASFMQPAAAYRLPSSAPR